MVTVGYCDCHSIYPFYSFSTFTVTTVTSVTKKIEERMEEVEQTALEFLQRIYRDPMVALPTRLRAAIEAAPYESPKLSATAVLTASDFAQRLDGAIQRSQVGRLAGPS